MSTIIRQPGDPSAVELNPSEFVGIAGQNAPEQFALQTGTPKTGAHTHTCSKSFHIYTCNFSVSCSLEMIVAPGAQVIIDITCPFCINQAYGNYAR